MNDNTRKLHEDKFKNPNLKGQDVTKVSSEQSTGEQNTGQLWQAKLERKAAIKFELSRSKQ